MRGATFRFRPLIRGRPFNIDCFETTFGARTHVCPSMFKVVRYTKPRQQDPLETRDTPLILPPTPHIPCPPHPHLIRRLLVRPRIQQHLSRHLVAHARSRGQRRVSKLRRTPHVNTRRPHLAPLVFAITTVHARWLLGNSATRLLLHCVPGSEIRSPRSDVQRTRSCVSRASAH